MPVRLLGKTLRFAWNLCRDPGRAAGDIGRALRRKEFARAGGIALPVPQSPKTRDTIVVSRRFRYLRLPNPKVATHSATKAPDQADPDAVAFPTGPSPKSSQRIRR